MLYHYFTHKTWKLKVENRQENRRTDSIQFIGETA